MGSLHISGNEKDVLFVGRLAQFKYFNMDAAIRAALDTFDAYRSDAAAAAPAPQIPRAVAAASADDPPVFAGFFNQNLS